MIGSTKDKFYEEQPQLVFPSVFSEPPLTSLRSLMSLAVYLLVLQYTFQGIKLDNDQLTYWHNSHWFMVFQPAPLSGPSDPLYLSVFVKIVTVSNPQVVIEPAPSFQEGQVSGEIFLHQDLL
ncbi:hypothetical protein DSO57_1013140 [Entomophthora muscae]|uniref:Uncharacterized protein n=1 Tax=Entomophthora muscae TaxID=34485 RepID=A0ACC2TGB8_9FUNG|nr:hypothetical protein DSO57_1013140 [Entomophthora muscae]